MSSYEYCVSRGIDYSIFLTWDIFKLFFYSLFPYTLIHLGVGTLTRQPALNFRPLWCFKEMKFGKALG